MRGGFFCAFLGFVTFFAACSSTPQQQTQAKSAPQGAGQQPAEMQSTPEASQARAAQVKPPRTGIAGKPQVVSKRKPVIVAQDKADSTRASASIPTRTQPVYVPPVAVPNDGQSQVVATRDSDRPATAIRQPAAVSPPPPPPPVYAIVRVGTKVAIRLTDALDSSVAQADDTFHGTLDDDLVTDGRTVLPRGAEVTGKVVTAGGSGRVKGRANLSIILTEIRTGNGSYPIRTNTLSFEAEGTQKQDAVKVGGGASIGAIIGAIAGGGKGAAIGAAVGGAAGTAGVLVTKGKEVRFSREDRLAFSLREDLEIRLQ